LQLTTGTHNAAYPVIAAYVGYNESFTGGPRAMHRLAQQMNCARHRPIVLTNKSSPLTEALARDQIKTVILPQPSLIGDDDGKTLRGGILDKIRACRQIQQYNNAVERVLAEFGADALIVRNVKGVLLTGTAAKHRGIPLIWDIGGEKPAKGIIWLLHTIGLRRASRIVTQASSVAPSIFTPWQLRRYGHKIVVNPSCVAPEREAELQSLPIKEDPPWSPFVVLIVGSLHPNKNQLMLLRTLSELRDNHPDIHIEMVGPDLDEEYADMLRGYVKEHGLSDRVAFHGWQDDITPFLKRANMFCLTSKREGVPQAVLEAMHAGVPVLSTAAGGIREVLEHGETGYMVDVDDQDAFTHVMSYCLDHQDELATVASNARTIVAERYSVAGWYNRYEHIIDDVLDSKPPK